jgi:hypothetical protein
MSELTKQSDFAAHYSREQYGINMSIVFTKRWRT